MAKTGHMLVFGLLRAADGQSSAVDGADRMLCSLSTCFPGSSSSALGLQSLGLSGQAPSSSSLDAGTLSDTTASGNCPQQGTWLRASRPCSPVQCCESVTGSCFDRPSWTSCFCLGFSHVLWKAQCCNLASVLVTPLPHTLHAAWLWLILRDPGNIMLASQCCARVVTW